MNAKSKFFTLPLLGLCLLAVMIAESNVFAVSACLSARFNDRADLGCRLPPGPWRDLQLPDNQKSCTPCTGMPRWWVSEPNINLWVADEPLSYLTSSGQRMSFRWTHQQRTPELPREYQGEDKIPIRLRTTDSAFNTSCSSAAVMSDAQWSHNWWSEIVFWDPYLEMATNGLHGPSHDDPYTPTRAFIPFTANYQATVYLGQGGTYSFTGATAGTPQGAGKVRFEIIGDTPSNGPEVPVPEAGIPDAYPTNAHGIVWVDNPQYGFRMIYPDGSQDVYGFVLRTGLKPFCTGGIPTWNCTGLDNTARAYLTQRIDPQGRVTHVGYEKIPASPGQPAYVVRYIVDSDGRTNTYYYNPSNRNQLTSIEDPYGRTATFNYDVTQGLLSSIIDSGGLSNSFQYVTQSITFTNRNLLNGQCYTLGFPPYANTYNVPVSGWLASITTPYGTNSFSYFQDQESGATDEYTARAVLVTEPNSAHQLFYYRHVCANLVPTSATAPTNVPGATFDTGLTGTQHPTLDYRNSFHWDRRQFAALSVSSWGNLGSALSSLTTDDYSKGTMQHWLLGSADLFTVTASVSSQRDPSSDAAGQIPGARTWYDYAGKPGGEPEIEGTETLPSCIARILPDGTTQYTGFDYTSPGYPAKQWETYTQTNGAVAVRTNTYTYAANGVDLISYTNAGTRRFSLAYTTNHQVTFLTNALAEVTTVTYTDLLTEQKPHVITFPSGQTVTLEYYKGGWTNINGTNVYVWLPDARFLKSIQWSPGPTWSLSYDKSLVKSATSDLGLVLNFTWDGLLRPTSVSFPDSSYISNRYDKLDLSATRDREGHWTYFGHDALQHLTRITNANNAVTQLSWCDCGALESITDALTNVTSFYYDNQGNLTNRVFADNSSLKYGYDSIGRISSIADGLNRTFTAGYNQQGLLTTISNAYGPLESIVYDVLDRPFQITDANNVTVTHTFNALDRLITRTWPDNGVEKFGYTANGLIAYTNQNQQVTRYTRDGAGRLTALTNANLEVTRVALNSLGQVTDLWDGRTNHTGFGYNEYGWLTNKTDALDHEILRLTRNANGQMTNRWTRQFGITAYAHDALGNLTNITYPSGTAPISLAYDALNRLTNILDAVGTTRLSYSAAGQLLGEDGPWSDDAVTNGYAQTLRAALGIGSGWSQTYGFDPALRLTNVTSTAGTFRYGYVGQASRLSQMFLPNTASGTNHYDALSRLDFTALVNPVGRVLEGYAYTHDPRGLRTNLTRIFPLSTNTVSVGYDAIGQLTAWTARESSGASRLNEQLRYAYDAAGNLLYRTNNALSQVFTIDPLNQLTNVTRDGTFTVIGSTPSLASNVTVNGSSASRYGDHSFASAGHTLANGNNNFTVIAENPYGLRVTNSLSVDLPTAVNLQYDANGNLTNDGLRSFAYDAENQLTNITLSTAWKTEFVYDGFGRRRIAKEYDRHGGVWVKTNETRFVFDGPLPVQERDSNNVVKVTYTRGRDFSGTLSGAGGIGGLLARTDTNGSTFYHADGAGNITALMNAQGVLVARYLYEPFGGLTAMWGPLASVNRVMFSSKQLLPHTEDIYDFGRRDWFTNPQRWGSRDPSGERSDVNLYRGMGNNPISNVDPYGLDFGLYNSSAGDGTALVSGPLPYITGDTVAEQLGGGVANTVPTVVNSLYNLVGGALDLLDLGFEKAGLTGLLGRSPSEMLGAVNPSMLSELQPLKMGKPCPPAAKNVPKRFPPGYNPNTWEFKPPPGKPSASPRFFSPEGEHFRWHDDSYHIPHWDYQPWPSGPWKNMDDYGQFYFEDFGANKKY